MIAVPNIAEFIGVRSGCLAWAESRVKCDGVRGGGGEGREDRGTRGAKGNLAERDPLGGRGRGPLRRSRVGECGCCLGVQVVVILELTVILTAGLVALTV